jgi:NADH:ubiquinone oxidoreductase subunit 2 (subunit N)
VSLAGIPPTAGFWGKFYLFTAVVQAHYTWLAIVAVVMSAVSVYYYLRVVWFMYFREAPEGAAPAAEGAAPAAEGGPAVATGTQVTATPVGERQPLPLGVTFAVGLVAAAVVLVGLYPQPFLKAAAGALRVFGT